MREQGFGLGVWRGGGGANRWGTTGRGLERGGGGFLVWGHGTRGVWEQSITNTQESQYSRITNTQESVSVHLAGCLSIQQTHHILTNTETTSSSTHPVNYTEIYYGTKNARQWWWRCGLSGQVVMVMMHAQ